MIGFDIGGTKCSISIGKEISNGIELLDKKVVSTDCTISAYEMIDRMCETLNTMTSHVDVIGVSCGGPLNSVQGLILSPPNLPGWDNVNIVAYLKERYKTDVYLENDANACALAEWKYGAGRGYKDLVFLTFGTGLGAGLILNGKLCRGGSDMSGEVGHIRLREYGPVGYGKQGSFEGFCSGGGIAQLGRIYAYEQFQMGKSTSFCAKLSDIDSISARLIAECAKSGHNDAIEIYKLCGRMLGEGLSVLVDVLNPECIILGSIFERCEELIRPSMESVLEKECLKASYERCSIIPAKLGDRIGDYAALAVASMNSGVV